MNIEKQSEIIDTLLGTVYDLNDMSEGVSKDLEILISSLMKQIEDIVDSQDKLIGDWK
tara:strand:+ start:351 stop:524 length:174 start_codon:yes stop_codon:yes gene_type:complete